MDFQVEIEYWEDARGISPVADFIGDLPAKHQAWIAKRDEFFESMTMRQLMQTQFFEKAKGQSSPLWELKYSGSGGKNYRMLCIICKHSLIGLVIFQGSGSGGKLNKFSQKAIERGADWRRRNP